MNLLRPIAVFAFFAIVRGAACLAQTTQPQEPPNPAARWVKMFDRDQSGFTVFPLGQGARIVLLSTSDGSDFNDGMLQPVRSLQKALSLVRNGFPDRILFKRGDVFAAANLDANIEVEGRSSFEPLIIGAYGNIRLPRPLLRSHLSLGAHVLPRFLVLQSLDLFADTRDPSAKTFNVKKMSDRQNFGIGLVCSGRFLWIEDCRCRDFGMGLNLQGARNDLFDTLVIRRCQILDSWAFGMSSGIYLQDFQNVLIEENLFDHNGWIEHLPGAGKTMFNHNMYLQHGAMGEDRHIIVRNNVIARAASHGCQLRPGGLLENNLFLKNPLAAFVSYSPSVARDNVVLDGDSIALDMPRGQGLEFLNCYTVLCQGNIVAHKPDKTNGQEGLAFKPEGASGTPAPTRGEFRNNIVYDWAGPAFFVVSPPKGLSVHDNDFEQKLNPVVFLKDWKNDYVFRNNHYSSGLPKPFRIADHGMDLQGWIAQTGETPDPSKFQFTDPSRDIASYAKSIGLPDTTLEGFLAAARDQRRGHWDNRLTADAVNDYIRAGFARRP
ncbi:MAG: right-handed parallel beta-helix repeat-containing protein [Tepidisphaeraceae bacterium]